MDYLIRGPHPQTPRAPGVMPMTSHTQIPQGRIVRLHTWSSRRSFGSDDPVTSDLSNVGAQETLEFPLTILRSPYNVFMPPAGPRLFCRPFIEHDGSNGARMEVSNTGRRGPPADHCPDVEPLRGAGSLKGECIV